MSGIIEFNDHGTWWASSGIFHWVLGFLTERVESEPDREWLVVIDKANLRSLYFDDLSERGVSEVLAALRTELEPYAQEHFPDSSRRDVALRVIRELVDRSNARPSTFVNLDVIGKVITRAFPYTRFKGTEIEIDGDPEIGILFEKGYIVHTVGQTWRMAHDEDDDRIQACFGSLYRLPIRTAVAEETGALRLTFADGSRLECGPDERSEPWVYRGRHRERVWSLPGGRLIKLDPVAPYGA